MAGETVAGRASYQLGVDLKPLQTGLTAAEGAIKKSGKTAEDAFGRQGTAAANKLASSQGLLVKQSSELQKGILAGVGIGGGIVAFNALKGAVTGVVGGLFDMARSAAEEQTAIDTLTQAIKVNDTAWDGNIAKVEERIAAGVKLAFSDDDQRAALQSLVSITKDTDVAFDLLSQSMDLARLKGLDLGTASGLLGKVYAGNLGTLSRYGIVLEKGSTATEALAEIQKRAQGQAKAYASEGIGAIEAAELRSADAGERLGKIMIPVVAGIADVSANAVEAVAGLVEGIGNLADAALDFIDSGRDTRAELEAIADTLDTKSARSFLSYQKSLRLSGEEGDFLRTMLDSLNVTAANQANLMEHLGVISEESGNELGVVTDKAVTMAGVFDSVNFVMMSTEDRIATWRQYIGSLYEEFDLLNPLIEGNTAAVTENAIKVSEATTAYLGWLENTELGRQHLAKLNAEYDVLSSIIPPATEAITESFGTLKEGMTRVVYSTGKMPGAMAAEIKSGKDDVREAMTDLRWAMEHPFAGDKYVNFLQDKQKAAQRKLNTALEDGNVEAANRARAIVDSIQAELERLDDQTYSVSVLVDPATGRRRSGAAPGRASGGWVGPGAYQINERGTEMLLMGGRGYILDAGKTSQLTGGGGGGNGAPSRHDHYHHIDAASAGNLRAAGFDEVGVASLLRNAARTADTRYRWSG
jgi:hypothetical protein